MFTQKMNFSEALSIYEILIQTENDPNELEKIIDCFHEYAKQKAYKDLVASEWLSKNSVNKNVRTTVETVETESYQAGHFPFSFQKENLNNQSFERYHDTYTSVEFDQGKYDEAVTELNSFVGLETAKKKVQDFYNFAKLNDLKRSRNIPIQSLSLNILFTGDPGTGKTTVARCYAKIFHALGLLQSNHFVEVSRANLIGEYIGHTEQITSSVFESALDGVLFIDEAHNLYQPHNVVDFGHDCLTTLIKLMEDYRERIVIIFAGYENEMEKSLLQFKGMRSRIPHHLSFKNYTSEELSKIFLKIAIDNGYALDDKIDLALKQTFAKFLRSSNQKINARTVRNMFENTLLRQAKRILKLSNPTNEDIQKICLSDIELPRNFNQDNIIFFNNTEKD